MHSFLRTNDYPNTRRVNSNISSNRTARIKENGKHYTSIAWTVHFLGWQDPPLRENYDNDDPSNEDIIDKRNFKESFNVTCKSSSRLQEMFFWHVRKTPLLL